MVADQEPVSRPRNRAHRLQSGAGGRAAPPLSARTTTAVVLSILGVIVVNSVFTLFYTLMGS